DLARLAEDFGAEGIVVDSDEAADDAVKFLLKKSDLPRIVELRVDPEDLPPINIQGSLMF
ncbi:MAG TPA: hypothetical protein VJR06_06475, partial [Nitrososphaerales archaeon]|nr:hypothetical protein [Nitrososphaerales archaeon]